VDRRDAAVLFRSPGGGRAHWLVRAGCAAAIVLIPIGALAGCGSEDPSSPGAQAPGVVAPDEQNSGTTAEFGSVVDIVSARIPAPAAGATQAELEMTLAVTSETTSETLTSVTTPAARGVELLSGGHAITRMSLVVPVGNSVQFGPPGTMDLLLTGLKGPLKLGQSVKVTMTFGKAATGTMSVPVTAAP
jgi:copper(I)-binding protein